MAGRLTDVQGIRVGHYTDRSALTGCTVVLCDEGTVGGVALRGGCPGTRETPALETGRSLLCVDAILLAGGSVFGLDAAAGVMRYLEEQRRGQHKDSGPLPVVAAAVIFDLAVGRADVRPTADSAYQACLSATNGAFEEGNVGVGASADVGKLYGHPHASRGGLGTASVTLPAGVHVAALAVVNAFGDVIARSGEILAGARDPQTGAFADTESRMQGDIAATILPWENTTLVVVATDAGLTKEAANRVAQMADDGIARAIRPAHTSLDGDVVFALATGRVDAKVNLNVLGAMAARVTEEAIQRAVSHSGNNVARSVTLHADTR
jgi:L-aminopeptidase/D-esterase-like protein